MTTCSTITKGVGRFFDSKAYLDTMAAGKRSATKAAVSPDASQLSVSARSGHSSKCTDWQGINRRFAEVTSYVKLFR